MKHPKLRNRFTALSLMFLMVCTVLCCSFASAEETSFDETTASADEGAATTAPAETNEPESDKETGSITVVLTDGKEPGSKEGVIVQYAKVAEVEDGMYVMIPGYEGVDLNAVTTANELDDAAQALSSGMRADGTVVTDRGGKAVISGLHTGVYLLTVPDNGKYDLVSPVLIAIPTFDETSGEMQFDVQVIPKHTPPPETTTHPTETPPKTGEDSRVGIWMTVAILSAVIVAGLVILPKIRRGKED